MGTLTQKHVETASLPEQIHSIRHRIASNTSRTKRMLFAKRLTEKEQAELNMLEAALEILEAEETSRRADMSISHAVGTPPTEKAPRRNVIFCCKRRHQASDVSMRQFIAPNSANASTPASTWVQATPVASGFWPLRFFPKN